MPQNNPLIALKLAKSINRDYQYIERKWNIFDQIFIQAISLTGMQVYNECQFLGYGAEIKSSNPYIFTGLGLDILCVGLYQNWYYQKIGKQ